MDSVTRDFDSFAVGQSASLERIISAEDVAAFARLTGDDNPVHVDNEYARSMGLGGGVVHGMLTASFISTLIGTALPGPGALWLSERFSFRAPARIGDRVQATVTIRRISPSTRVLVLDVEVRNQRETLLMDGEAQVHVLKPPNDANETEQAVESVVVTGSGRGIGASIAKRLAATRSHGRHQLP